MDKPIIPFPAIRREPCLVKAAEEDGLINDCLMVGTFTAVASRASLCSHFSH